MIPIKNKKTEELFDLFEEKGYDSYLIGGYVRDFILGSQNDCYDIDIITNAKPQEVIELLKVLGVDDYTENFGCVNFKNDEYEIEVTTFRKEGNYSDCRRPDSIDFCDDIHQDLIRRDFTINAIAYNKKQGFIDDFNGFYDIHNNILRCIGDAEKKLSEDYLRILRALRFLSNYNLTCEENTENAIFKFAPQITILSSDRINNEFYGIIKGKNSVDVFLQFEEVIKIIIPELNQLNNFLFESGMSFYQFISLLILDVNSDAEKYFALFILLDSFISNKITDKFVCQNDLEELFIKYVPKKSVRNELQHFLKCKNFIVEDHNDYEIKKAVSELGQYCHDFIGFFTKFAFLLSMNCKINLNNNVKKFVSVYNDIIENSKCISKKQLAITGETLLNNGYKGKDISISLDYALDGVMQEKVCNKKEDLLEYLKGRNNE